MAYRAGRRERSPTSAVAVCIALVLMSSDVCKSQPIKKPPVITYVAGPNQLTLLFPSNNAFRFGYDTDNQFRAERRFANGTVAGYYGYMRADGNPVRVKYGDVDNLGFSAIEEIIPVTFPPTTTEANTEEGSGSLPTELPASSPSGQPFLISDDTADKLETLLVLPKLPVVDDEKESVSVDAADFFRSTGFTPTEQEEINTLNTARFVFPEIDVPDLPTRRKSRSIPRAVRPSAEDRSSVVMEQLPGEPAIIFKEPTRFKQTASIRYTLN